MAQSFGRTKVLRIQTIPKISKNRGFQSRGKQRSAVHNLDPGSYQNPRKRALEEARGFGQIFIIDSLPSSLGKNGDDKTLGKLLLQQRKRQFAGGGNEDPEHFGWAAESHDQTQTQTQSMPYDDFRSLVAQRCESSSLSFHTKTDTAKNASELAGRMVEKESQKPPRGRQPGANPRPPPPPMGEIVEVEGGHIVRSTGRKDRHSKVYTAKGPRDRRVRLSAATAIQFYDLQDRLGYDRPSKAVAWLIDKAKASIDELAKLPKTRIPTNEPKPAENDKEREPVDESPNEAQSSAAAAAAATSIKADHSRAIARERARERAKERTQERDAVAKAVLQDNRSSTVANSVPPSYLNLFSNANIQSLQLPNAASKGFTAGQSPHTFHPAAQMNISPDSFSRSLNLQASQLYQSLLAVPNFSTAASQFDSPTAVFSEADNSNIGRNQTHQQSQFSSSAPSAFQAPFTAMPEQQNQQHHEFAGSQQPQRISRHSWNSNGISISNAAADNCAAYSAPNIRGQCQQHNSFTFRGTLQSSSSPIRVRPMPFTLDYAAGDPILQNPATTSGSGEYSGYRYPARIQGIDEHDDVKPSAASSNSQL